MEKGNSKEFDIIDLVSIVIRYRKTVLVGFLTSLIVLSAISIGKDKIMDRGGDKVIVDYSISLKEVPTELSYKLLHGKTMFDLATYQLSKPQFLAEELAKVNFFEGYDNEFRYNQRVSDMIESEQYKINESLIENQLDISFKTSKKDLEKANMFLQNCVRRTDSLICSYIMERAERLRLVTAKSIEDIKADVSTKSDMSFYQDLQNMMVSVDEFVNAGNRKFVVMETKPFVREKRVSKVLLIVSLAAICAVFWILVAICLDWIARMKSDEAVRTKISNAWHRK